MRCNPPARANNRAMPQAQALLPIFLKPPLKWAGGKRWLVPHLAPFWRPHSERRLVEPFCGGLAVSLGLAPRHALLNDRNPHVIRFYLHLKAGFRISLEMANDKSLFYSHRNRFNELLREGRQDIPEASALFYFLNRTGFNGLCRFNRRGEFNVPFGEYKRINYERDFSEYRRALAGWDFATGDFAALPLAGDDFVYADPPYDVQFTQYSSEAFGWEDQVRVADWLARHKGPAILSNQATDRILALYRKLGFEIRLLDAPRRISCTGDRRPAKEVLALRNL
jgi:DNA adenine methylase